jgi:hypothetical protein
MHIALKHGMHRLAADAHAIAKLARKRAINYQPAACFAMREKVKTAGRAYSPGEAMGRAGIISNEAKQPARRCAVTCNPEFAGGAT